MAFFFTLRTPEQLPDTITLSSDPTTLPTQVSLSFCVIHATLWILSKSHNHLHNLQKVGPHIEPFHQFCRYNQHSRTAGHPVSLGSGWRTSAPGCASCCREAAGPSVPRGGFVPGEDLWWLEGPRWHFRLVEMWAVILHSHFHKAVVPVIPF